MQEKSTDDLRQELMERPDLDTYLKENQASFVQDDITGQLAAYFERGNQSKAALARKAGMSEVYLHQVFSGRRKPSRDRLLCLCVGMGLNLEETQRMLKRAACAPLYPKHQRDAIISHGIIHGTPLSDINEKLFRENEKSLY